MKIAYFDCFSGISGDMCLGALISAGVDFETLRAELLKLPVQGYDIRLEKVKRNGIGALNVFVDLLEAGQPERRLFDIEKIIGESTLPEEVKAKSKEVFQRLAVAEAAVHDTTSDHIHFHEVGAVDAIVDVVGTVLGLHLLGVEKVLASPLPMGKGFIKCMHGIIPSPAPATLEVLKDVPVYGAGFEGELVTPTGAALISVLADEFVDFPAMTIGRVGYGAGKKITQHPNLLRLVIGESYESKVPGPFPYHTSHDHGHRHAHPHDHVHAVHAHCHEHRHGHVSHSHHHEHGHDHHGDGLFHGDELQHEHEHHHDHHHDHHHGHGHGHGQEHIHGDHDHEEGDCRRHGEEGHHHGHENGHGDHNLHGHKHGDLIDE
ncbi:MAG: LarC family nickel insertion protein [Peptococcaceae bacterium]|nr:LarC family nickel insertion protein [Peptococcaceae bacterium]